MKKNRLYSNKTRFTFILKALVAFMIIGHVQILLSQDDIPSPPAGFDGYNSEIEHGTTEVVYYYSSTVGIERRTRIYLPPGYNADSTYNVLYLLHGIGGDINEWYNNGKPHYILDNLYAKDRIKPMIVVLPNGRAMEDDSPGSDIFAPDKVEGFANFEFELITDLIPFIDTTYSVKPGREARAIAGLSMGGGQALNFGLAHLDTFAWVGAFSPAPNTKLADSLIPDLAEDSSKIMGLWISCGSIDGLIGISENTHNFMVENNIDHYYLIEPGKDHEWSVWKAGLYHFSQRIFGQIPVIDTISETTDIQHNYNDTYLRLSYNPFDHILTILENTNNKILSIYDLNGRLKLYESDFYKNTFDISHLNSGMYIVVLYDDEKYLHDKIVKL